MCCAVLAANERVSTSSSPRSPRCSTWWNPSTMPTTSRASVAWLCCRTSSWMVSPLVRTLTRACSLQRRGHSALRVQTTPSFRRRCSTGTRLRSARASMLWRGRCGASMRAARRAPRRSTRWERAPGKTRWHSRACSPLAWSIRLRPRCVTAAARRCPPRRWCSSPTRLDSCRRVRSAPPWTPKRAPPPWTLSQPCWRARPAARKWTWRSVGC
mmetsp:Transcript_6394/g.25833  ORF Transcript_6394/g.25833 Transcript_6394/m.25833 type:complete len:213 (+) Transcript_6394:484-1122(+)